MTQRLWKCLSRHCYPLLHRIWREERGANMVIVALALMVLFGFGGVAIDGGNAFYQQQRMQIAADAAALGGARSLALGQDTATVDARIHELAFANDADSVTWDYINGGRGVRVVAQRSFETYFARLYGHDVFEVAGTAEAQYEPVTDTENLFPMTYSCNCLDGGESTFPEEEDPWDEDEDVSAEGCELYPIALHESNIGTGGYVTDIYNGAMPGNFGWLTWDGQNNAPAMATMLTPPGNSHLYTNPHDAGDHAVSIGDWVQGLPGVTNSSGIRGALDVLKTRDIVVPVWGTDGNGSGAIGQGAGSLYHVVEFALVRIVDYRLPSENRISANFKGLVRCDDDGNWIPVSTPGLSTVDLLDSEESEYEITYMGHENNTWTYRVNKISGGDLTSWSLGAGGCNVLNSTAPGGAFDAVAGADSITWNLEPGFTSGEFSFTLDDEYMATPLDVTITSGPGATSAVLTGPDCYAPVDGDGTNPNTELSICLAPLDFETDDAGGTLVSGQIIDNEWAAWGVHVTTNSPSSHPAMIFDSSSPTGGDNDLGTPNQDFGGPGVGDGGKAGMPGENSQALGKVLIISEDNKPANPDDNGGGGTVIFTFDLGIRMDEVHILDIDDYTLAGTVRAYSDVNGGNLLVSNRMAGLGDNSVQVVPVNATGVRRLEIEFPGGGAVPAVISCRNQASNLYAIGGVIWHDANADGVQGEGEPGVSGVELELYASGMSQVLARMNTSSSGGYQFKNLPAGSYTVKITDGNFGAGGPLAGAVTASGAFSAGAAAVTLPLDGGDNLSVNGGFILPGGSGGDAGPQTALVSLSDNKSTQYEIALVSHHRETWTYRVSKVRGWNLKQWTLGIGNCAGHITNLSPTTGAQIGGNGITWIAEKPNQGFNLGEGASFSITLDNAYAGGRVSATAESVKGGQAEVVIIGPDCSQIDTTPVIEDPIPGGGGGDEDVACDFRWLDWNGGARSTIELKNFMDAPVISGDWKLGDVIPPGMPVTNNSLIAATLNAKLGQDLLIPLTEWNGVGYQVCGFANVRLLSYELASNPIQMTVQFLHELVRSGDSDPNANDYGVRDVRMLD